MTYDDVFEKRFPSSDIERRWDIAAEIYRAYEDGRIKPMRIDVPGTDSRSPRTYIGASRIGHECERAVWLEYRGLCQEDFEGRMLRLFKRGDIGEVRLRYELQAIGFEVGGDQSRMSAYDGRFAGHTDGFVRLPGMPWLLFEAKTASHKSFNRYVKHGLEKWKPTYWHQIHTYMAAFGLDQCLYAVVDKNTDTIDVQLYDYDEDAARFAYSRAARIVGGPIPERPWGAPRKPTCLWCSASGFCWEDEPLERKCGSCKHWRSHDGDTGECLARDEYRTQHSACEMHDYIEQPDENAVFVWGD